MPFSKQKKLYHPWRLRWHGSRCHGHRYHQDPLFISGPYPIVRDTSRQDGAFYPQVPRAVL